jgi:hypothetical protein
MSIIIVFVHTSDSKVSEDYLVRLGKLPEGYTGFRPCFGGPNEAVRDIMKPGDVAVAFMDKLNSSKILEEAKALGFNVRTGDHNPTTKELGLVTPTVTRMQMMGGEVVQGEEALYVGRRMTMGGWDLKLSKWHNKFSKKNCEGDVCDAFEADILMNPELLLNLHELSGQQLGCWCKKRVNKKGKPIGKTQPCHADRLVKLFNELL